MAAGSQAPLGIAGAGLRCSWRRDTRTLVMAGKGSHRLFHAVVAGPATTACPGFLAGLAPDARVHAAALQIFEDILSSPDDTGCLPATLDSLLGGAAPRSVLCTGACVGGLLATLAAAWAALRWPDADVRCIVFGTPRLANAAFNQAFGWLVGLSYRCVYRFDPMPDAPLGATSGSPLLGLLGRLRLEFTPTQPDVFLDGRGHARLEDRPIQVQYKWSDHDLRAYLSTLLELAEEHHWSVSPPINQMGMCELVDPFVMARESQLRLAAQHGGGCEEEAGQVSCGKEEAAGRASPGSASASTSLDPSAGSASSPPASPGTPAPAAGGRAATVPLHQASLSGAAAGTGDGGGGGEHQDPSKSSVLGKPASAQAPASPGAEAHAEPASRMLAAAARSTQLSSSMALPDSDANPAAAQHGARGAPRSGPGRSFSSRLRGLFTAAAASVPATSAHLLRAWQEIREALGQIEKVHTTVYPGPGKYVGEAAADSIVQQFAAGQALAHQATSAGSTTGGVSPSADAPPEAAVPGVASGEEAAESDSGGFGQPRTLQQLVAARLRLPLRLSLAAYEDEAGFRRSTGIAQSAMVDDRLFDAQVHVAWLPAGTAGTAVFAFRGTSNRADMLADIKMLRRQVEFLPTQLPGAKCHLGFLQQALAITSATSPACNIGCVLASLSGGAAPTRIICCGHSLGGAVASIASVWAALQWPHADVRCFSFGAPKCGNRKFVRAMQTLVGMRARVVHGADPIPSLPPAWLARYHHVSPTCHLRGSELVLSPGPLALFARLNLRDHQLLQYAKALAAAARAGLDQEVPSAARSGSGRQRADAADLEADKED
ncbi:hypothetical protein ABPG75_008164 [Micractinium tetrahymenae]